MITYILGLILILLGYLTVKYPKLLYGSKTMSKEERDKVDIKGLTRMIRSVSIGMGFCIIIGTFILDKTDNNSMIDFLLIGVILGGVFIIAVAQRKYTKETTPSKVNIYGSAIVIFLIISIISVVIYISVSDKVIIHNDSVEITGPYGLDIPTNSINKIEYREFLPDIGFRKNGISFWKYHKGHFRSSELGNITLFLHSKGGPYLVIYSENKNPVIINRSNTAELYQLFVDLNTKINN